jgi:hypothetical protein
MLLRKFRTDHRKYIILATRLRNRSSLCDYDSFLDSCKPETYENEREM